MSKKVLVISSSPRKNGNSDTLCDQFIRGATDAGHIAEKVFLSDKKIGYCIACCTCITESKCSQNDDMGEIIGKLIDCDVLVLATPVYFYCMSAQLKTFIDRIMPRYMEIKNKKIYFILTAADTKVASVYETLVSLRGFIKTLPDSEEKGSVHGLGMWDMGDALDSHKMVEAYKMGKTL